MKFKIFFVIIICFCSIISGKLTPKIAIIGGGIGGTSCAYFLRDLFKNKATISLFERDVIGGRLHLLNVGGNYYESGGSVIHPKNKYMVDFVRLLGLTIRKPELSKFGIFNGDKFVFKESDWYILTYAYFFWRYGFSYFDLEKQIKSVIDDFTRIYSAQEQGLAFRTVDSLLNYMNPSFRNMTQETLLSYLTSKGYKGLFVDELVQSIMMVNYGQTNNISNFAGFVSLAGADNNLWCIKGGNKRVPEGLLAASKALVINGDVKEIVLQSNGTYLLRYNETSDGEMLAELFDIIVIATPFIKNSNNIKFINFPQEFDVYEIPYHQTVTTFVQGVLNPKAFNTETVPDEIVTFKNTLMFNSISKVNPVSNIHITGKNVYKIFSQNPLTSENIKTLFKEVEIIKSKEWLAYPHYQPPEKLPPFILNPGLYYANAIELSASAMEMSSIAGKNIALLAYHLWNNKLDLIDNNKKVIKDEL